MGKDIKYTEAEMMTETTHLIVVGGEKSYFETQCDNLSLQGFTLSGNIQVTQTGGVSKSPEFTYHALMVITTVDQNMINNIPGLKVLVHPLLHPFTVKVQVRFPKSKKVRIRKKWSRDLKRNFTVKEQDMVYQMGDTILVSKKVSIG